jgi:hypothetical protein
MFAYGSAGPIGAIRTDGDLLLDESKGTHSLEDANHPQAL